MYIHIYIYICMKVGRMLLLGSAAGACLGVHLALMVDDATMKRIFAVGMFGLGLKTVM